MQFQIDTAKPSRYQQPKPLIAPQAVQEEESFASLLPIKPHNGKVEHTLAEIRSQMLENKLGIEELLKQTRLMGDKQNAERLSLYDHVMGECQRLVKDLREMNQVEKGETFKLKQQIQGINQDKIRLQQNIIVLENRVVETDKDIGFKRRAQSVK